MRRKINIQGHIDREREYSKKFGQLAKYEMIDGNLSWEEAKKVTAVMAPASGVSFS